ncbi:MAG: DNA repair protein RecO, partial [Nitrospirae bacterium]|nr:DNA repair protein RecO [Nitrospirota bacterium]
ILKSFPLGEADLIVTIYTLDYGLVRVFAKSPRKTKSRFGSSLEPFSYNKITFLGNEDNHLPRLIQADIIYPFQSLRDNLKCYIKSTEILEVTLNLQPERLIVKELFYILLDTLKKLDSECNTNRWNLFYKIKLLKYSGLAPELSGCVICNCAGRTFYIHEGAVICEDCFIKGDYPRKISLSQGAINLYITILKWNWDNLHRIKPSDILNSELNNMIDRHIEYRSERNLKTKWFNFKVQQVMGSSVTTP